MTRDIVAPEPASRLVDEPQVKGIVIGALPELGRLGNKTVGGAGFDGIKANIPCIP